MAQEFLRTLAAYGWTFADVEQMTLKQFVNSWAMVAKLNGEKVANMAVAARASKIEKPKEFTAWVNDTTR